MLDLGATAGGCFSQLVLIMGPPLFLNQRFGTPGLRMSRGLPCMVEIYDQDNRVLFMLDSHRAGSCKGVLDSGRGNV